MPKIVSRSIVCTDQSSQRNAEKTKVYVYYCICGELAVILDTAIDELPARRTDRARMLDAGTCAARVHAEPAGTVFLKRPGGCEQQHRLKCKRCGLVLMYQVRAETKEYFIMDGALIAQGEATAVSEPVVRTAVQGTAKAGSVVITSADKDLEELEKQVSGEYDSNAEVITRILGHSKRAAEEAEQRKAKRGKGTLMVD